MTTVDLFSYGVVDCALACVGIMFATWLLVRGPRLRP
jgi:hypothetical protein